MSVDETKTEPLPTAVAESPPSQAAAPTVQVLPSPSPTPPPPPPPASAPAASVGVRIRPKTCDVRNCDSNSLRNPEILFVCVPGHSYPERRFVWLTLMQAARDKKRSYCCSRHFKVPDDFKDFQEFISAPPGYKRQLLVKKGVVPHLNMPPLNMSALPPLTNRWPMTLPAGMTEADQQRQNTARPSMPPPLGMRGGHPFPPSHGMNNQRLTHVSSTSRVRYCKAVQTEPPPAAATAASAGQRKVAPSLQYCRLCFKRQDLEPIFTGDQTLIEPDLIDKIFGCTEVRISVESDFPSSICTACYTSVQEFVKFRKLVQQNDQSLRGTPLPPMTATNPTRSPSFGTQTTSVRTKTTETIPGRPGLKVTPVRPVNSVSPARRRDDPLLEVQRVENVERYQRRQQTIERNQPLRAQRMQDTLYPVPYRRPVAETATSDDPLANAEDGEKPASESESSSTPEGVQLNDRVVPVTLIRVQPEATGSNEDVELEVPNTGQNTTNAEGNSEDVTVKTEEEPAEEQQQSPEEQQQSPEEQQQPPENPPPMNTIRAKPLHQLMASPEQSKLNPPSVLQAVKLLPSATARALANQRSSLKPVSTLTRGITSGRFPYRVWKPVQPGTPKQSSIGRMFPKSLVRAVRFPGAMSTLFSGARKHHKPPTTPSGSPKPGESPKPVECPKPAVVIPISGTPKPVEKPKPAVVAPISIPDQRKTSTTSGSPRPVERPKPAVLTSYIDQRKNSTPSGSPRPVERPKPAVFISNIDQRKTSTPSGSPRPVERPKPAVVVPISNPDQRKAPTSSGSPKPVERPKPAVLISNLDQRKASTPSGYPKFVERPKPAVLISNIDQRKSSTPSGSPRPVERPKPAIVVPILNPDQRKPPTEKPQVLKEWKLPVKSTAPSPVSKAKTAPQSKLKENSVPESPRVPTPDKPVAPAAKLPVKSSAPLPVPKPAPKLKQTETPPAAPPPAPSSDGPPPSPRSSRVRKVPIKFQDSVGFPMPKIITVKSDPDSSKVESPKVPQEDPKELPVRNTRRSNVTVEKASESRPPAKPDRKQPEVKHDVKNKQPKEDQALKVETAVVRLTRRSDAGARTSETQQKLNPPKRKSDTKPDAGAKEAPPPAKSPRVEPKRNSLDTSKTKQQQQKQKQEQQKQKQEQRANGSRKSVPTAEVKQPKKPKEPEPAIAPPVSSQDWKCPFCPDKVYDQKKGLVKHLRKRHGMDYALVRQRLAIYGGNWR